MNFFKKILVISICAITTLFSQLSYSSTSTPCMSTSDVIKDFNFAYRIAPSLLSLEQRFLAAEFFELLNSKVDLKITCQHTSPGENVEESDVLLLETLKKAMSGKIVFNSEGNIKSYSFDRE